MAIFVMWLNKQSLSFALLPTGNSGASATRSTARPNASEPIEESPEGASETSDWVVLVLGYLFVVGAVGAGVIWVLENWLNVEDAEALFDERGWPWVVIFLTPAAIGLIVAGVAVSYSSSRATRREINLHPIARVVRLALIAILVGAFIYAPFIARNEIVGRVELGEPTRLGLPFMNALNFRRVELTIVGTPIIDRCVVLLGIGNGMAVYFDPEASAIGQSPTDLTILREPCLEAP